MKKILIITCVLCFFFQFAPAMNYVSFSTTTSPVLKNPPELLNISTLKIKEVEKLLGRKMKLKEKIAFKLFQWKLKNESNRKKGDSGVDKGKTAMILGIVGIGLLLIPYVAIAALPCAILAIIFGNKARKENQNDGRAKAGIILGWVTIGLIVLAIALLFIILASWGGFYFGG